MTAQFIYWHLWPTETSIMCNAIIDSEIIDRIYMAQKEDNDYQVYVKKAANEGSMFMVNDQGQVKYLGRVQLSKDSQLRNEVLASLHNSKVSIHPGGSKIYHEAKHHF